jgi:toxin ParE1/3/4
LDVEDAHAYYLVKRAGQAALGFIDALERAYGRIAANPASARRATS